MPGAFNNVLFIASWETQQSRCRWEGVCLWFLLCLLLKSENALLLTPQPREGSPRNQIPLHTPLITHSREVLVVYFRAAQARWYSRGGARPAGLSPTLFTRTSSESDFPRTTLSRFVRKFPYATHPRKLLRMLKRRILTWSELFCSTQRRDLKYYNAHS